MDYSDWLFSWTFKFHKVMRQQIWGEVAGYFRSSWQDATVKGLLKSVHICQSYHKKTVLVFFDPQCRQCRMTTDDATTTTTTTTTTATTTTDYYFKLLFNKSIFSELFFVRAYAGFSKSKPLGIVRAGPVTDLKVEVILGHWSRRSPVLLLCSTSL